ncbi:phosphotransferase family protein [Gryllotalpicola protaetiae]|uniref:Aminoglycoside phosphotransferase family protein n=1 Tax=Gryllotalpicola protaetiae TaxID=2419771 RepID=A0A387C3B1_9MICO|nr:aminoglycoside phosphotransferase family protein [Gryllotalpicola protaetiae]AYG05051.1 aminoglycoside phosphotransferase family protein [Gryllotalpicola protaetiae]
MTDAGRPAASPSRDQLVWVLQLVGGDAVTEVKPLKAGGSQWLITWGDAHGGGSAVLRVGGPDDADQQARAETAMPIADLQGVPVPNVLGSRVDDESSLLLVEWIDGASAQPIEASPVRLEALGAMAATIFRSNLGDLELPEVARPIDGVDFAALRAASPHPLLERAARRLDGIEAEGRTGLVHGDLWSGNTLWRDGGLVAVIDWGCAGAGRAGVDLGSLRLDAAMNWGQEASAHVLAGWEREAGEPAQDLAYWDAVAAVNTPPDLGWFVESTIEAIARPDLTRELMVARRDAFLADALDRLR